MSSEMKLAAVVLLIVTVIFFAGFGAGYVHVIISSEAYAIEDGSFLMLEVDGNAYQYEVSPEFHQKIAL